MLPSLFFILTCCFLVQASLSKGASPIAATTFFWEHDEDTLQEDFFMGSSEEKSYKAAPKITNRRRYFWFGTIEDWKSKQKRKKIQKKSSAHLLRMSRWDFEVEWKRRTLGGKTMRFEFAENGYVRMIPATPSNEETAAIGTWKLTPSGVTWSIALGSDGKPQQQHHCYADLHLNPFGKHPRMSRGIIVQDRPLFKGWFRPVVATFSGVGIGKDMADFTYQERGFGPYQKK